MTNVLLVGIGGFFGAISRYGLANLVRGFLSTAKFPWPIFAVNILGCFVIGILYAVHLRQHEISKPMQMLLLTGFLGGFTTFSTFGWETFELLRSGETKLAVAYSVGSLVVGVLAVWGAFALVSSMGRS